MTFTDFYLLCFLVGFLLSVIGALSGSLHMHFHVPHLHLGHFHLGDGHGHGGHAGGDGPSVLNFGTVVTFLAWFGGAGYFLSRYSTLGFLLSMGSAIVFGLAGAAIIFLFLMKISGGKLEALDPADFEMVGVLGKVNSPIRAGGTGEIVYSQAGTRRCAGARSEDAKAIEKGTEVIVTRYDKGIAYVRPWDEMTNG